MKVQTFASLKYQKNIEQTIVIQRSKSHRHSFGIPSLQNKLVSTTHDML